MIQLVLETALDAAVVMGSDGIITGWNAQAELVFGWTCDEALGVEMASLIIPPQYRASHREGLAHYLATGEGPVLRRRIEITALRKNGEEFPVELSITPVSVNEDGVFLGFVRDISDRRSAEHRQGLLLAELEHRSKNMLAVVMGIASQTAKSALSVDAFIKEYLGRLASLSRAYGLLTEKNWQVATLGSLVTEVIGPHLSSVEDQLTLEGGNVVFPAKAILTISMILHELTTNAIKYGALRSGGKIHIQATATPVPDGEAIRLIWQEEGVGDTVAPARSGFGSKLIETSVRHELKGSIAISHGTDGIRYVFEFTLKPVHPES
jgi:PAS domain S-box-containing protein